MDEPLSVETIERKEQRRRKKKVNQNKICSEKLVTGKIQ